MSRGLECKLYGRAVKLAAERDLGDLPEICPHALECSADGSECVLLSDEDGLGNNGDLRDWFQEGAVVVEEGKKVLERFRERLEKTAEMRGITVE